MSFPDYIDVQKKIRAKKPGFFTPNDYLNIYSVVETELGPMVGHSRTSVYDVLLSLQEGMISLRSA